MSSLLTPDFFANVGPTAAAVCILWWRIGRVESRVKMQNGRIDKLEEWKSYQQGRDAEADA